MIFSGDQLTVLDDLYSQYNDTIKPLLIQVESRYESLPTPIHNELRSFNDHIARCYIVGASQEVINNELKKAGGHIKRTIFDCFKFLNVKLSDFHKDFEKRTRNVDLTTINNGKFYIEYSALIVEAQETVRRAKKLESETSKHEEAFTEYEKAFGLYSDLEKLIHENVSNVNWARTKSKVGTFITYFLPVIGFFGGLLVEDLIKYMCGNKSLLDYILEFFNITKA